MTQVTVNQTVSAALTFGTSAPPSDATSLLQGIINAQAGAGEIVIPAGVWNISSSLVIPTAGMAIRGEWPGGTTIHLLGNFVAFVGGNSTSNLSAPIAIRDLVFTGSAPAWDGATINISDSGQGAVHLINCTSFKLANLDAHSISGTAFDFEAPLSGFNLADDNQINDLAMLNCYRGIHTRNSFEYARFGGCIARGCIFGIQIESGNIEYVDFLHRYNYNSIQVIGRTNANPGHCVIEGGESNHAFYGLQFLSCPLGGSVSGCHFIGDPGGSLTEGGEINIANCKEVNISGGTLGQNVVVQQADPSTGATSSSGENTIQGTTVRDDIPGWANPSVGAGAILIAKNNVSATSGALATWNN